MYWIQLSACFKRSWNILMIQGLVLSLCAHVSSIFSLKLPDVHWNRTNPMFKTSNNNHVVEVNMDDDINFVCPYYSPDLGLDPNNHEYYIIHRVTRKQYLECNIDDSSPPVAVINCSTPQKRRLYTITFSSFLPIPNAIEFKKGETYYFISTSTGAENGLHNRYEGACAHYNMKLTIKVCCDQSNNTTTTTDPVPKPVTMSSSTTPSQNPPSSTTVSTTTGASSSTAPSTSSTVTTTTKATSTSKSTTLKSTSSSTSFKPSTVSQQSSSTVASGDSSTEQPGKQGAIGGTALTKYSLTLVVTSLLVTMTVQAQSVTVT